MNISTFCVRKFGGPVFVYEWIGRSILTLTNLLLQLALMYKDISCSYVAMKTIKYDANYKSN
uniref:Uncharacterized protein n=1 Tax=Rhizophora mucronata TaxID=61149 RepID=A0A2P2NAM7_RHIMU